MAGRCDFVSCFAARQCLGHAVCKSSWCLCFRSSRLSGARVPKPVARPRPGRATHAYSEEQTPLPLPAKAILTRHIAMIARWISLTGYTPLRWWLIAMLSFWSVTVLFVFADFVGERWFGISWRHGPDLFPNMDLGYPLAICQIIAGLLLVASGVRLARDRRGPKGIALGTTLVIITGVVCFAAYTLFGLWYHIDFMGRTV